MTGSLLPPLKLVITRVMWLAWTWKTKKLRIRSMTQPGKTGRKNKKGAGRPPVLTPALVAEAYEISKACRFKDTLAAMLGVKSASVYDWLRRGRRLVDKPIDDPCEHDHNCVAFYEAVRRGHAETEVSYLSTIAAAGAKSWQAVAWILERTMPEKYGSQTHRFKQVEAEIREMKKKLGMQKGEDPATEVDDADAEIEPDEES